MRIGRSWLPSAATRFGATIPTSTPRSRGGAPLIGARHPLSRVCVVVWIVAGGERWNRAHCGEAERQNDDRCCHVDNLGHDGTLASYLIPKASGCPAPMSGESWSTALPPCGTQSFGPGLLNCGVIGCCG
jgi:hypothetical protein